MNLVFLRCLITFIMAFSLSSADASGLDDKVNYYVKNAKLYSSKGRYDLAVTLYTKAIQTDPNNIALYYDRAMLSGRLENYLSAIRDFSLVIQRSGNRFPHAIRFRADCYMALKDYRRAIDDYTAFLNIFPQDGKVWFYKAEALSLYYRNDLALKAIQKGLMTNSHWSGKLQELQRKILMQERIIPHKPLSN